MDTVGLKKFTPDQLGQATDATIVALGRVLELISRSDNREIVGFMILGHGWRLSHLIAFFEEGLEDVAENEGTASGSEGQPAPARQADA